MADHGVEEQLLTGLIGAIEGEIPACMFENECESMLRDYENRMAQQGITLDMYMKYTGFTREKMLEDLRPQAERQVKATLALEAVAKAEAFEIGAEDIEAEYQRVAESYKIDVEKAKEFIPEEIIKKDIAARKAVDVIKANAVITETTPEKKAPAKKAPAKKAEDGEKKPAAKKAPAKKAPAKKAEDGEKKPAAKKAPAKKKAE